MTERERLLATAGYFASGSHPDRGKAVEAYQALLERYPDEGAALQNLAQMLASRHEFARAESLFLRRVELDSTVQFAPFNVIVSQGSQGDTEAMKASIERARRLFPGHVRVRHSEALVQYVSGNFDSSATIFEVGRREAAGDELDRSFFVDLVQAARRLQGRFRDAHEVRRQFSAQSGANSGRALIDSLDEAALALWFHDRPGELVRRAEAALRRFPISPGPAGEPYVTLIKLFAAAGRPDRARNFLSDLEGTFQDSVQRRLNSWQVQVSGARIALAEGRFREAIDLYRTSNRRSDGPRTSCQTCEDPEIGLAFDRANLPDSTIRVYEHFLNTPDPWNHWENSWERARILRRLGELHEAKGNRTEAANYYQKFLDLWKNADPELQHYVVEIRQRLARLGTTGDVRRP
jgi:tetratricopeptide (TPR) repeat protein